MKQLTYCFDTIINDISIDEFADWFIENTKDAPKFNFESESGSVKAILEPGKVSPFYPEELTPLIKQLISIGFSTNDNPKLNSQFGMTGIEALHSYLPTLAIGKEVEIDAKGVTKDGIEDLLGAITFEISATLNPNQIRLVAKSYKLFAVYFMSILSKIGEYIPQINDQMLSYIYLIEKDYQVKEEKSVSLKKFDCPNLPKESPKGNDGWNIWFDWYHEMKENGYRVSLRDIAERLGYEPGYVRQKHILYKCEHAIDNNE